MKNNKTENWMEEQEKFESISLSKDDKEVYNLLFKELQDQNEMHIPEGFADKVSRRAINSAQLKSDLKVYGFYAGLIFFCILFFGVLFKFTTGFMSTTIGNLISSNLVLVLAIPLVYFIVQSLDRILIQGGVENASLT